jgi:hypothetical protein
VQGIWVGMLIGTILQTVILFVILFRTKWEKEVIEHVPDATCNKLNRNLYLSLGFSISELYIALG